jgi:hypothetical protein
MLSKRFREYARRIIVEHFDWLDVEIKTSKEWLDSWNQPSWRRAELEKILESGDYLEDSKDLAKIDSFIKREFKHVTGLECPQLGEPEEADCAMQPVKHARLINARRDEAKLLFGPIGSAMDQVVFRNKHFIKKVAWKDRAKTISDRLVGAGRVYANLDYTSFECSFGSEWIRDIEVWAMEEWFQNVPSFRDIIVRVLGPVLAGLQSIRNSLYKLLIRGTRMSGEMFTSCCNGLGNYVLVQWLFSGCREDCLLLDFFLEGDDNVLALCGHSDTAVADARSLGFDLKYLRIDHPGKASFCGLLYSEHSDPIRDAAPVLAKFGWTNPAYHGCGDRLKRRLLLSKALSVGYENGKCPILWKLAQVFLRKLEGTKLGDTDKWRHLDQYERLRLKEALDNGPDINEPTMNTRLFYEETFGVPVIQQLQIERELEECGPGTPMCLPSFIFPTVYTVMYNTYVASENLPYACILWEMGGGGHLRDL